MQMLYCKLAIMRAEPMKLERWERVFILLFLSSFLMRRSAKLSTLLNVTLSIMRARPLISLVFLPMMFVSCLFFSSFSLSFRGGQVLSPALDVRKVYQSMNNKLIPQVTAVLERYHQSRTVTTT